MVAGNCILIYKSVCFVFKMFLIETVSDTGKMKICKKKLIVYYRNSLEIR